MKDLIRKILKEEQDEFEWVQNLDVNAAEKEVMKPFTHMEYEWSFEGPDLYKMLVDAGIHNLEKLQEIGDFIKDEVSSVYDRGYEHGQDNYDCDGCCDDYYYEDQVNDIRREAHEEGDTEGYERGREESQDEIDELKGQISELQDTIEELHNRLTS